MPPCDYLREGLFESLSFETNDFVCFENRNEFKCYKGLLPLNIAGKKLHVFWLVLLSMTLSSYNNKPPRSDSFHYVLTLGKWPLLLLTFWVTFSTWKIHLATHQCLMRHPLPFCKGIGLPLFDFEFKVSAQASLEEKMPFCESDWTVRCSLSFLFCLWVKKNQLLLLMLSHFCPLQGKFFLKSNKSLQAFKTLLLFIHIMKKCPLFLIFAL